MLKTQPGLFAVQPLHVGQHHFSVVRMQQAGPNLLRQELPGWNFEDPAELRRNQKAFLLRNVFKSTQATGDERQPEALLLRPPSLLHPLALSDIFVRHEHPGRPPALKPREPRHKPALLVQSMAGVLPREFRALAGQDGPNAESHLRSAFRGSTGRRVTDAQVIVAHAMAVVVKTIRARKVIPGGIYFDDGSVLIQNRNMGRSRVKRGLQETDGVRQG